MTAALLSSGSRKPVVVPQARRWSKEEYHAMWDLGWFNDQRVELLDGEIVEMPNPNPPHCVSLDKVAEFLFGHFPRSRYWVRNQMPLDLGLDVEPQPDLTVADGPRPSFTGHPTTALLVVEISDSTLAIDRGMKRAIYARAGIADYWIVNINDRCLEVYRRPVADATAERGFRYDEVMILREDETVSPLAAPAAVVPVSDLLP